MQDEVNKKLDHALLLINKGDKSGLSDIYEIMSNFIISVAFAITNNIEDSEDILQDTLIEISRKTKYYKFGTKPKAWILKIAKNKAIDSVRKKTKNSYINIEDLNTMIHTDSHDLLEICDLLKPLNFDERIIILLKDYVSLSMLEISKIMDLSIHASYKRYRRAINKLRNYLEEQENE